MVWGRVDAGRDEVYLSTPGSAREAAPWPQLLDCSVSSGASQGPVWIRMRLLAQLTARLQESHRKSKFPGLATTPEKGHP